MRYQSPIPLLFAALATVTACTSRGDGGANESASPPAAAVPSMGQASVQDDESAPDVVKIAVGSKDHTTLVAALKAADLVNSLANAGPFTVFAPTNAAFDKLPAGTVEDLLKPANVNSLRGILQHHVTVSVFEGDDLTDGLELSMADGKPVRITRSGADILVDGAKIIGSVRGSNGIVHVVDGVVLPK